MKFSTETVGKLWASGRHYVSMSAGLLTGIGLMSAADNKGLTDAVSQIYDGMALVVTGASSAWQILLAAFPIIGIAMAKIASNSAKTDNQAASVAASAKENTVSNKAKADMLVAVTEAVPLAKPIEIVDKNLAEAVPSKLVK